MSIERFAELGEKFARTRQQLKSIDKLKVGVAQLRDDLR